MPRRRKDFRPVIFVVIMIAFISGAYMLTAHDWGGSIDWSERGRDIIGAMAFIVMIGFCFYGLKNVREQPRGGGRIIGTIFIFFFLGILFSLLIGYVGGLISAPSEDLANSQTVIMIFSVLIGVIMAFVEH